LLFGTINENPSKLTKLPAATNQLIFFQFIRSCLK
jgi:hypothetical protein